MWSDSTFKHIWNLESRTRKPVKLTIALGGWQHLGKMMQKYGIEKASSATKKPEDCRACMPAPSVQEDVRKACMTLLHTQTPSCRRTWQLQLLQKQICWALNHPVHRHYAWSHRGHGQQWLQSHLQMTRPPNNSVKPPHSLITCNRAPYPVVNSLLLNIWSTRTSSH